MAVKIVAVVLAALLAVAAAGQYPTPSFYRRLTLSDPYAQSFCIENGNSVRLSLFLSSRLTPCAQGTAQGTGAQMHTAVQVCQYGQIAAYVSLTFGIQIHVGNIGGVFAAGVDLGSQRDLEANYTNGESAYISLYHDTGIFHMSNGDGGFYTFPSHEMDQALSCTDSTYEFYPEVDHVYIVRFPLPCRCFCTC